MAQQTNDQKFMVTGTCRFSYVHLTEPRATVAGGKPKYGITILIPKADFATKQKIDAAMQAAIAEGVASKWSGQRPAQPKTPLYDGDGVRPSGEAFGAECKGHWVLTASSENRPGVVDANLAPILDASQIYSGIFGRASIRFFPYFNSGNKGIGCGLNNVQKLSDGEPLASRSTPDDDFSTPAQWTAPAAAPQPAAYAQPAQHYAPQQQPQYVPPAFMAPPVAPMQPAAPQYQAPQYQAPQPQYGQPPFMAPQYAGNTQTAPSIYGIDPNQQR